MEKDKKGQSPARPADRPEEDCPKAARTREAQQSLFSIGRKTPAPPVGKGTPVKPRPRQPGYRLIWEGRLSQRQERRPEAPTT